MSKLYIVKVKPQSSVAGVDQDGDLLLVKVKSAAADGKANQELIKLLAKYFGVTQSEIEIKSGLTSRTKRIRILRRLNSETKGTR